MRKNSQFYDMESFEFLDHINFNNGDFDELFFDYIEDYIYSCRIL